MMIVGNPACLLCGANDCKLESSGGGYSLVRCQEGYNFGISDELLSMNGEDQDRFVNLIFEHMLRERNSGKDTILHFYFDPDRRNERITNPDIVNLANAFYAYPRTFVELTNRTLLNLSRLHSKYGEAIGYEYIDYRTAYCVGENKDIEGDGVFNVLLDLEYLSRKHDEKYRYYISANGWRKIEELQKRETEINQAFIAMSFNDETKPIRRAFCEAINGLDFAARLIDEKEHNNQIVPEIFYEIQRSKFIVVDVTYPNYGAYYEAGYAQGLGKEVIVCCSKEAFYNVSGKYTRPHFDISQKSMVIWEDLNDLVIRLQRRIEATVR